MYESLYNSVQKSGNLACRVSKKCSIYRVESSVTQVVRDSPDRKDDSMQHYYLLCAIVSVLRNACVLRSQGVAAPAEGRAGPLRNGAHLGAAAEGDPKA